MIISIINLTAGKIKDSELQKVIRAINRQIHEDFAPHWHRYATLRLEGHITDKPKKNDLVNIRGDAVIYLWDKVEGNDAVGYHDINDGGIPFGFVFLEVANEIGEPWSVTLSHECLELIGDPEINLLVAGPHPDRKQRRQVFHWYEMCDAVQDDKYEIDGILVSNFVLPLYFTKGDEYKGRNDFMGTNLKSFGVNPGGYSGFYDPRSRRSGSFEKDERARKRMKIKTKFEKTRKAARDTRLNRK